MSPSFISTKLPTAAKAGHWVWLCYLDCLCLGSSNSDVVVTDPGEVSTWHGRDTPVHRRAVDTSTPCLGRGGRADEVPLGGVLPYTGEGPLRRSLMSVPFSRNSALMLLVFDHWNEKEMISGLPSHRFSRCELLVWKWPAGQGPSLWWSSHSTLEAQCVYL